MTVERDRRKNHVVVARQLARRYEQLRRASGMSQTQAARALGWSLRKQQLLEQGGQSVSTRDLEVIVPTFGIPADEQPEWHELVGLARGKAWWDAYGEEDLPAASKHFIGLEQGATRLRAFEPLLIHWQLQTERYRAAVAAGMSITRRPIEHVNVLIEISRRRQQVLDGPDPLELWAVIDEGALHRVPGSVDVMHEQLIHIADVAETHANLTVQIIPIGAGLHAGLQGSFALMEFAWNPEPEFVYTEPLGERPTYLERRRDIYAYSAVFDRLVELACSPSESLQMLRDLAGRPPGRDRRKQTA
jgi:transcriptional regulator with XRE-family HTH domain